LSRQPEISDWEFLIGYPLERAEEILREEGTSFQVVWTAAPKQRAAASDSDSSEDAFVIAVRSGPPLSLVCAVQDWTVN